MKTHIRDRYWRVAIIGAVFLVYGLVALVLTRTGLWDSVSAEISIVPAFEVAGICAFASIPGLLWGPPKPKRPPKQEYYRRWDDISPGS